MEIERKWMVEGWPAGLPLVEEYAMRQGYISVRPTVRIREEARTGGETAWVLCFKSAGGLAREEIERPIDKELFDHAQRLFQWRRTKPVIHNGRTMHFLSRDNTYAYFRYTDDQAVFVYINNNDAPRELPWSDYAEFTGRLTGEGRNVLTGESFNPDNCTIPAKSSIIIEYR